MSTDKPTVPHAPGSGEWNDLRSRFWHRVGEALDLIMILLQDAVILLVGFLVEFVYEHWLHSTQPMFQFALNLSSGLFLLLYGITVTVHIVEYIWGKIGGTPANGGVTRYLPWTLAAVGVIAAAVAIAVPSVGRNAILGASPDAAGRVVPQTRLELSTPPSTLPFSFAISPDGRKIVFVADEEGGSKLWLRPLDQKTAQPLAGTDGASHPFWAPDSRGLGFFAGQKLKRIDVTGGPPLVLADAQGEVIGGTWNREGVIVFGRGRPNSGLIQVAASGGPATVLTHLGRGLSNPRWPQFLPDGRRFLFFVPGSPDIQGVYVGSLDGNEPVRVLATESSATYAPPGYLMVVSQGVLVAYRFDAASGVVRGDPLPVEESVGVDLSRYRGAFSVSETGELAYRNGRRVAGNSFGLTVPGKSWMFCGRLKRRRWPVPSLRLTGCKWQSRAVLKAIPTFG